MSYIYIYDISHLRVKEKSCCLITLTLVPTVLAAVTNLAEGPALSQQAAVNIEWSLVILGGTRMQTVLSTERQVILLTKTLIRNRASRLRRPK